MRRPRAAALALLAAACGLSPAVAAAQGACGEVVTLAARPGVTTAYSLARGKAPEKAALVLLVGGPGIINLDTGGCPRLLAQNSLIRKRALFHDAGFATALLDAPSDHRGGDGLGGFRLAAAHAEDLGKVVADLRRRTDLPVWLVGTSRGAISAANAAARLSGPAAPDGLVLTSPITSGRVGGQKAWVAQTVFGARLESIRVPVLVVAHADDVCIRTPPGLAGGITARTRGPRQQTVTVAGGPGSRGRQPSVEACQARSPHGFLGQEAAVAAGVARFIGGGRY